MSTAAGETTRVRSATGHGTWTIRTISAGPTSCVGGVFVLTSDKMWRRRMYVCGRSRQHLFLHGPSTLMGVICKPGNGHVSAVSPWAHGRDRSTRGLSMARCSPVAPSLNFQPRGRADLSEPRLVAGRIRLLLRRSAASSRSLGSPRARWGLSRWPPPTLALISSALHRAFVSSLASHRRRPSASPGWRVGGARSESAQAQPYCPRLESAESRRAACTP